MEARKWVDLGRVAARGLLVPAILVIVWGELVPGASLPIWDKLLHFTAYFGLGLLAWIAFHKRGYAGWAVLGIVVLGGILEIVQGYVGRDMDIYDEVANALGALSGAGLAFGVRRFLAARGLVEPRSQD